MKRRSFLSLCCVISGAGCSGWGENNTKSNQETPTAEETPTVEETIQSSSIEDSNIDQSPEALLLSNQDLQEEWIQTSTEDEACRELKQISEDIQKIIKSCIDISSGSDEAQDKYNTKVERSDKLRGNILEKEPDIGTEAAIIDAVSMIEIIFYDANVVGSIEYQKISLDENVLPDDELPDVDTAVKYAASMRQGWRTR